MLRFLFSILGLILALNACTPSPPQHKERSAHTLNVFGQQAGVTFWAAPKAQIETALIAIKDDWQQLDRYWHLWQADSPLYSLNQALAREQSIALDDPIMTELLQHSQTWYTQSQGVLNSAAGQLWQFWGFQQDDFNHAQPAQDLDLVTVLAANPQPNQIHFSAGQLYSDNPAVQLDFNLLLKGYAVDRALSHIQAAGIDNAIVNINGHLQVQGHQGRNNWTVGIINPLEPEKYLGAVPLNSGEAMSTASIWERQYLHDEQMIHAYISAQSGKPISDLQAVTVIADNSLTATAAASSLLLSGAENWYALAQKLKLQYVLVVDEKGILLCTPDMSSRLRIKTKSKLKVVVVEPTF